MCAEVSDCGARNQVVGGYYAGSLAIMTDAAHLLSDLVGFLISILALYVARKAPTSRLSFGFHRAEILGALVSVFLIWILSGVLLYEAVLRSISPIHVDGKLMFIVASVGLGINLLMGLTLGHGHSHGHSHSHVQGDGTDSHTSTDVHYSATPTASGRRLSIVNVNVKAAQIHVAGDAIQSVGVMIAGLIIWLKPSLEIADPICTFVFAFLVLHE